MIDRSGFFPPRYGRQHAGKDLCGTVETRGGGGVGPHPVVWIGAAAGVGGAHSTDEAGESRWREGALVLECFLRKGRVRRLGDLRTPDTIRNLQRKLYLKAKKEPEYRFYALYDKLYRDDILAHAYEVARANEGAPGVDGVTFKAIELRDEGVEALLAELKEELKTGTYRPKAVRRVYIPKPDGGQRPLGIPCIRDRVAQAAAKLVLEPIFEADFTSNAYAYRPKRGAHQAIKHVHRLLQDGYVDVVDADLSKYFDTIPHAELMRSVARRVSDRKILALVKSWLRMPVEERTEKGKRTLTGPGGHGVGTPQGGVISPLLANIYMRRFLLSWDKWELPKKLQAHVVNYADDFVILCRGTAHAAKDAAETILSRLKLTLSAEKTRVVNAWQDSFDFLGYTFGRCFKAGSSSVYLGAKPSKKRVQRFYKRVREFLHRGNQMEPTMAVERVNSRMLGWAFYYSYGTISRTYKRVDRLVSRRLRAWLCRRHGVHGRGTRRFPDEVLYGTYGLVRLLDVLARRRSHA